MDVFYHQKVSACRICRESGSECAHGAGGISSCTNYPMLARQLRGATLDTRTRRIPTVCGQPHQEDTEPPRHAVASRADSGKPGRSEQSRWERYRGRLVLARTRVVFRPSKMATRHLNRNSLVLKHRKSVPLFFRSVIQSYTRACS